MTSETKVLNENIIEIKNLKKYYPLTSGLMKKVTGIVRAVDDVTFNIPRGKTIGLVGESGCGKTTISKCILRAIDPTEGDILLNNEEGSYNLATLSENELRPLRKEMQMIFQDPFSSLNPRMNLFEIVSEPLLLNGVKNKTERQDRVEELLNKTKESLTSTIAKIVDISLSELTKEKTILRIIALLFILHYLSHFFMLHA